MFLAAFQAFGISRALGAQTGVVINPGFFFDASTVVTLVGGTMFLMWMGEQVTARGVGNGVSLIIFAGIVAELPRAIFQVLDLNRTNSLSTFLLIFVIVLFVALSLLIVFVERAQRRLLVQYPKRQMAGGKTFGGESSFMPLKLNTAGVIPPIFASSLLLLPATAGAAFAQGGNNEWLTNMLAYIAVSYTHLTLPTILLV